MSPADEPEHAGATPPPSEDSLEQALRQALPQPLAKEGTLSFFRRKGEEARPQPAPGLAPGKVVGDFRLVSLIGQGGMGQVWEAEQISLQRTVAVKFVRPERVTERQLELFAREARAGGRLHHPGIVTVHGYGQSDDLAWIAMEYVSGAWTLKDFLDEAARAEELPEGYDRHVARFVAEIAEAMQAAHEAGVIHRDLKPQNVLITSEDRPKVTDFGLARITDESAMSQTGDFAGTYFYMSPEQVTARRMGIDHRTDVFSLGVVLYELLALRRPFEGDTSHQVAAQIVTKDPPDIRTIRSRVPRDLAVIAGKTLEKDRDKRFQTMKELAADLRRHLGNEPIHATPPTRLDRAVKWTKRNPGKSSAAAIVAVTFTVIALLLVANVRTNRALEHERTNLAAANTALEAKSAESEQRRVTAEQSALREKAAAELAKSNEQRADREAETATKRADEVLRLSALQKLEDLVADADRLWPAVPENLPGYAEWMGKASALVAELPEHEQKLADLRARGTSGSDSEHARTPATPLRSEDLERIDEQLGPFAAIDLAWRTGIVTSGSYAVDVDVSTAVRLWLIVTEGERGNSYDWADWIEPRFEHPDGMIKLADMDWLAASEGWGSTRKGRNCEGGPLTFEGQTYSEGIGTHAPSVIVYDVPKGAQRFRATAALDDMGSKRSSATELEFLVWLEPRAPGTEGEQESLVPIPGPREIANNLRLLTRKAVLEQFSARTEWTFEDPEEKWWHKQLEKLVNGIKEFSEAESGLFSVGVSPEHGWGIPKRGDFARTIAERSISGPEASRMWAEAMASIADPDKCPLYRGLRIQPQLGLLPIGRDPDSGLWEFAHLQTGEPAERGPDGKLVLKEETGLVFVLLPGGTFTMGAQRGDPNGPNYDPEAKSDEGPPRSVTVSAFFLSKYEMTQGQWLRFTGANPSRDNPESYSRSWNASGRAGNLLLPVEQVSWATCTTTLERMGLMLPNEAQWEFGARGGTTSVWWTGDEKESLAGAANLADRYSREHGGWGWGGKEEWLDDGNTSHAHVGNYRANPFGLHDVHGNVWEWCQGKYGAGSASRHVHRGGGFLNPASEARAALRSSGPPSGEDVFLGLRPARALLAP